MRKEYKVSLELYNSFVRSTNVNYIKGDTETMPLKIELLNGGNPARLSAGDEVSLNFETPERRRFTRKAQITDYERAEISYEMQLGDIYAVGETTVGVTVDSGDKRLSWHGFRFTVSDNLLEGQEEPPEGMVSAPDFFAMAVDEDGRLTIVTNDNSTLPVSISDDGHLIYTFK